MKTEATKEEDQNEISKSRKRKSSRRETSIKSLSKQDKPETNTNPAEHVERSESIETASTVSHDEPEILNQRRSIKSRKVKTENAKEEDAGLEPVKVGRRGRSKVKSNLIPETSNKGEGLRGQSKNELETGTKAIDQTKEEKEENDISISIPEPNVRKARGKRGKSNEEKVEKAEDENINPDKATNLESSVERKSKRGAKSRLNVQVDKEKEEEEEKDLPIVSASSRKRRKINDGNEDEIKLLDTGSKRRKCVSKKGNNSILTKLESKSHEDLKEESPVQKPGTENADGKRNVSSREGRENITGEEKTELIEPAVELDSKRLGRKRKTSLNTTNSTVDTSTRSSRGVSHPSPAPSNDTLTTSKTDKKRSKSKPVVQEISENREEIKSQTPQSNDHTSSERKSVKRKMESNSSEIVRRPKLSKGLSPSEQVDHDASLCGSPALRRATIVKKYKVLFTGYFCEKENQIVLDLGKLLIS